MRHIDVHVPAYIYIYIKCWQVAIWGGFNVRILEKRVGHSEEGAWRHLWNVKAMKGCEMWWKRVLFKMQHRRYDGRKLEKLLCSLCSGLNCSFHPCLPKLISSLTFCNEHYLQPSMNKYQRFDCAPLLRIHTISAFSFKGGKNKICGAKLAPSKRWNMVTVCPVWVVWWGEVFVQSITMWDMSSEI